MAIQTVNGYACASCADVALAKQGVDPTKAASLAEALANDAREKNGNAVSDEAVSRTASAERARLDYTDQLDMIV